MLALKSSGCEVLVYIPRPLCLHIVFVFVLLVLLEPLVPSHCTLPIRPAVVMFFHYQTCGVPPSSISLCFHPISFSLCGCVSGTVEALSEVGIHNIVSVELYVKA